MKAKHKKALLCIAAIGIFLSSAVYNEAKAEYVEPSSYTNPVNGEGLNDRDFSSANYDSYHFYNFNLPDENGGALITSGEITNSLFENNYANSGGAYYAPASSGWVFPTIRNTKFYRNEARYLGGAISSIANAFMVYDSVFEENKAGTRGGAIHIAPASILSYMITNCDFISNESGQDGGAIYVSLNSGDIRFIANDGKTHYMSGNMQNTESDSSKPSSNAIYIEKGKVLLQTRKAGSKYIINDGIQGGYTSSIDNAKLETLAEFGDTIELNNEVKYLALTHTGGNLGLNKSDKIASGGSILNTVDLTLKPSGEDGLRLDMQNGKIDNLKIRNFTVDSSNSSNIVIAMDVDLKDGVADNFDVSQAMSGKLLFDTDHFELNVINNGDADKFQLFNRTFDIEGEIVQYINNAKYVFSVGEDGFINVDKDTTGGLYEAIASTEPVREFKPTPAIDTVINKNLGDMGGESFKINLSGADFDGAGFSGINVNANQRLELKNIGTVDGKKSMHNFLGENGSIVKNEGGTVIITDSVIKNNSALTEGGAIYNKNGEVIINAETRDVVFSGNKANGTPNDIYMEQTEEVATPVTSPTAGGDDTPATAALSTRSSGSAEAILTVKGGKNTILEDGIKGNGKVVKQDTGTLVLGGDNSGFVGDFYLNGGEVRLKQGATFFNTANSNLSNGKINLLNNSTDKISLGNLNLNGDIALSIDANASTGESDKIGAASVKGDGKILIDNVNLAPMSDPTKSRVDFSVITLNEDTGTSPLFGKVDMAMPDTEVLGPIFKYKLQYDSETGVMSLAGGGDRSDGYNPSVLAAPVATLVGGYLTQLNSYDMAFNNTDTYMLLTRAERNALKNMNKYASVNGGTYSNDVYTDRNGWFKPYSTFESVRLQRGPRVSNIAYGSFFGYDSDIKELGGGFDGMWSFYTGYNGSHQTYQGNGIWQNGGTLGLTGVLYKGNFFTALTANAGANVGSADTMYGDEDFTMITSGIASKTGYNIEMFDGKFIIQPSYLMSYSFVKTLDYTNAYGLDINSKPLNAIQIAPGLRLIGNLPKGFQPYIGCSMVWNIIDDTRFKVNDVSLPELSVRPYFNYGAGFQKKGDRFAGYFQTMLRAGGRNGVALQGGFHIFI